MWRPVGSGPNGAALSSISPLANVVPSSANVSLGAVPGPARPMLAMIDFDGDVQPLQPHIGRSKPSIVAPGNTALQFVGSPAATLGTVTAGLGVGGGMTPRVNTVQLTSAAGAGSACGIYDPIAMFDAIAAGGSGVLLSWDFGWSDAVATANMFFGVWNSISVPTDVQPQTLTQLFGVGCTSGDTNLQLYAAAAAAQPRVSLGIPLVAQHVYRVELFMSRSTTNACGYQATDLRTGQAVSGTVPSAQAPTGIAIGMLGYRSNGGTATAVVMQHAYLIAERLV